MVLRQGSFQRDPVEADGLDEPDEYEEDRIDPSIRHEDLGEGPEGEAVYFRRGSPPEEWREGDLGRLIAFLRGGGR
jgi:hypothetical protein